jgi:hypothetical protein
LFISVFSRLFPSFSAFFELAKFQVIKLKERSVFFRFSLRGRSLYDGKRIFVTSLFGSDSFMLMSESPQDKYDRLKQNK